MNLLLVLTSILPTALPLPQSHHSFSTLDNPAFFDSYIANLVKDINTTYYCPLAVPKLTPVALTDWTELPETCLICCATTLRQGNCIKRDLAALSGSTFSRYLSGVRAGDKVGVEERALRDCVDDGRKGEICGECRYCLPVDVQKTLLGEGFCG